MTLHNTDRPSFVTMAGPSQENELQANPMELSTAAIPFKSIPKIGKCFYVKISTRNVTTFGNVTEIAKFGSVVATQIITVNYGIIIVAIFGNF